MSRNIGIKPLGYKTSSLQQPGHLGFSYSLIDDVSISSGDYYVNQSANEVDVKWVQNVSGAAIVPGTVVKRDVANDLSHDVETAGAGEVGCGIADPRLSENVADNERFNIVTKGIIECLSGGAVSKGDTVGVAANGKVVSVTVAAVADLVHVFGVALEEASGADELFRCEVDFPTR